ncbi:MAG TPA: lasso RiPP family leader peptide-containing protein [Gemmatimonadaceae bacterium]
MEKKSYAAPALVDLGSVTRETLGGGNLIPEPVAGKQAQ